LSFDKITNIADVKCVYVYGKMNRARSHCSLLSLYSEMQPPWSTSLKQFCLQHKLYLVRSFI